MRKSTDDLTTMLKQGKSIDEYLNENNREFIPDKLSAYLLSLLGEQAYSKVAKRGGLDASYVSKLCNGERDKPRRDMVIKLCFGLELNIEQSQNVLRYAGLSALYPKFRRDSIIMSCLESGENVYKCEEMLMKYGEKMLQPKDAA